MKKLFLGSVALLALGLGMPAAFAAEKALPAYTPPPPPVPVYTWSGCYVGANAGYSWGTSNRTAVFNTAVPNAAGLPITGDFGLVGFIGGRLSSSLARSGADVRCLVRDPARAQHLKSDGCERFPRIPFRGALYLDP